MMKILCVVGSKRKKGNSHTIANMMIAYLAKNNHETDLVTLSDYNFNGCTGCEGCHSTNKCIVKDDMQIMYKKINEADALICISPTYYYNVTSDMKKFIERLYAYQVFDQDDRSKWTSINDQNGRKIAATIAIYEQEDADGFTNLAMSKPLDDLGYDVVCRQDFTSLFGKSAVNNSSTVLSKVISCADQLMASEKKL